MVENLIANFNITERKSLTLQPPSNLSMVEKLCYIRGLIDGDGTIRIDEKGRLEFSIIGSEFIITWIKEVFDTLAPTKTKHLSKARSRTDRNSKTWTYKVTGHRAKAILSIFNKLNTPFLERKWGKVALAPMPIYGKYDSVFDVISAFVEGTGSPDFWTKKIEEQVAIMP